MQLKISEEVAPLKADSRVFQVKTIIRQWKMIAVNKSKGEMYHLVLGDITFNINKISNTGAQRRIFQGREGF